MRVWALGIILSMTAAPSLAEITGELRLGGTEAGILSGPALHVDLTWSAQWGRIGATLGSYGVWTETEHPHETYAALTYQLGDGQLSVGVPRPAYDLFAVSALDRALPALGITNVAQTRSHATSQAAAGNGIPLGLSYVGTAQNLQYAVTALQIDDLNSSVVSVGGSWRPGPTWIDAAVELVDQPGGTDINAKLAMRHRVNTATYSVALFHNDSQNAGQAVEFAVGFPVLNNVQIDLFAQVPGSGLDQTMAGAAVEFPLGVYSFLHTALARDAAGNGAYSASLGWRF